MDLLDYFKYRLFWVWLICMLDLLWLGWVGVLGVKRLVLCMGLFAAGLGGWFWCWFLFMFNCIYYELAAVWMIVTWVLVGCCSLVF